MSEASTEISGSGPRNSACPGLFRIVPARDGGICRVRLPLGRLSAVKARAVAVAADRFGNGIVEATNRANLQIRGVSAGNAAALSRSLVDAGLGPARPEADDVRNVMVSPSAGIDPLQQIDALPIGHELLGMIEADAPCRTLSAKFCILVDGGESIAALDRSHDIWLASIEEGARMALGVAGAPPVANDDYTPFLAVPTGDAARAVKTVLALFFDATARDPEITRLRHALARSSRAAFLDQVAERLPGAAEHGGSVAGWRRPRPAPRGHVGVRGQRQAGLVFIGAVPPLGRLSPEFLARLAEIADRFGAGELRLTPWQSVLLPWVRREAASAAVEALQQAGLTCDPANPLAAIVACAGITGCARARADTKAEALALAAALPADATAQRVIHLSGCAKSCACPGVADATLLATAPGRYQLFVKANNWQSRFGRPAAPDLTLSQIADSLREMDTANAPDGGGGGRE